MSEPTPDRPRDDELEQAYARSHALAGDGRGPAASVRANVLAAAAGIAAAAKVEAAVEAPAVVPVAPPVSDVGRGRDRAINLSSWRVRSGAAFCALMLVCLGIWRLDENGRVKGGVQVALAELRLAEPRTAQAPQDLPLPAAAAASYPYAAPPPVVVDPLDNSGSVRGATAKRAERDKDVVVAQLDERRAAAPRPSAEADALAQPRAAQSGPARAPVAADMAAPQPPVALASNAPNEQESATVTITATAPAAPPQIVTAPSKLPSVLPRRMMLVPRPPSAPAAKAAPGGDTVVASAEPADAEPAPVAGYAARAPAPAPMALNKPEVRLASSADIGQEAKAALAGASGPSTPLQAAADRGDVDALETLLADPAVRVDAPDADGRTALLHAVLAQRPAAVRLLLAAGADPARADRAGLTPRQAAQTGASAEIALLLGPPR